MGRPRTYLLNENFFQEHTSDSYYWAGFIAADGCIKDRDSCMELTLGIKDIKHLNKFNISIKSSYKIITKFKGRHECCSLTLYSKKLITDLNTNFCITPRKSLTLEYPKFTNKFLEDSFIRGYIDGDGCINKKVATISILGTHNFLSGVVKRFEEITNDEFIIRKKHKTSNIFDLRVYGNRARILFKHFSNLNVPNMNRKWDRNNDVFTLPKERKELELKFVAPMLKVSVTTLLRWNKNGKFKAIKRGQMYYHTRENIDNLIKKNPAGYKGKHFKINKAKSLS